MDRRKFIKTTLSVAIVAALPVLPKGKCPYKWVKGPHTEFIDSDVMTLMKTRTRSFPTSQFNFESQFKKGFQQYFKENPLPNLFDGQPDSEWPSFCRGDGNA